MLTSRQMDFFIKCNTINGYFALGKSRLTQEQYDQILRHVRESNWYDYVETIVTGDVIFVSEGEETWFSSDPKELPFSYYPGKRRWARDCPPTIIGKM